MAGRRGGNINAAKTHRKLTNVYHARSAGQNCGEGGGDSVNF